MSKPLGRMILQRDATLTCPHCERPFALADGFARAALEQLDHESDDLLASVRDEERKAADKRNAQLVVERERAFEAALAEAARAADKRYAPQLADLQRQVDAVAVRESAIAKREAAIESRVNEAAKARVAELQATEREAHSQALADEQARVRALQGEQIALREEKRRLQAEKDAMQLEVQKQVDSKLGEHLNTARLQEQERARLDKADLQKRLDDVSTQLMEAQRKVEQGSQQLQGEVLELDLEASLKRMFPLDTIEEVRKGARGGDLVQRVMTRNGQEAGVILWETKRAKDWSPQWCVKLKDDMRNAGAAIGILVTSPGAVPRDWAKECLFSVHEEVWVTHGITAINVAEVLRDGLIQVHRQRLAAAGKGEKAEALYDYLTSPQFSQKLRAVYETFQSMRAELDSERNTATQRWARREKQLQAGMQQLLGIGGEIQGLAHEALPSLELETPPDQDKVVGLP
ncbi:DUF2130 domain-containing protein [bacterium]|nr:MAG: DUF2130 domain-containing protein [bacterium]